MVCIAALRSGREIDIVVFELPFEHIRADIRIVLRPCLDMFDPEVGTDILDFLLRPARRCGHGEEKGLVGSCEVTFGKENVRIIADRTVTFVHDEERDIAQGIPAGDQVIFYNLGRGEDDGCPFPVRGTLHPVGLPR